MTPLEVQLTARLAATSHTVSLLLAMQFAGMSEREIEAAGEVLVYPYAPRTDREIAAMSEEERILRSLRQDEAERIFAEAKRLAASFKAK